ncbi:MAG: hypothetical protein GY913_07830 [Proteobacteria bacterium]|nr:hypothetical protein [Pseudomonadota bacterium]MCP4916821.1 hypothetical protein [Pseudomonadota bacterium]
MIPDEAVDSWTIGKAEFDAVRLAKVMGVISFFPALFTTICGLVAFFGDDKSVYWGIPFWGILVVFAWGGYVVAYLRHKREQA